MKKIYFLFLFALTANFSFSQTSNIVYTVSGTYSFVVPAGVMQMTLEVIGGGGRGQGNGTGGGGGGAYAGGIYSVVPGSTLSIRVGTPGVNPTAGTSSITGFITATGGANGISVANPMVGGGGLGGAATGGNLYNSKGGDGGGGYYTYFGGGGGGAGGQTGNGGNGGNCSAYTGSNCLQPGGAAGLSGGMPGANGGKGAGFTNSSCSVSDNATNGGMFGGGGGGGNGIGSIPGQGGIAAARIEWPTSTGITELSKSNVVVFPNPFTSKINVQGNIGTEVYELVNTLGQTIFTGKNIEEQDFSNLAKGVYFFKIQNTTSVIKLIKQ